MGPPLRNRRRNKALAIGGGGSENHREQSTRVAGEGRRNADSGGVPVGRALRILRIRVGISLTDAETEGGPDAQTVGAWEADTQMPTLAQLIGYLTACHLSLHDLQDALDQIAQRPAHLHQRLAGIERRLSALERR